ncbi:carboxyvinyl-carboxyphosphonate phosphorylmutase [Gracilaria domingensis]|nr:carboxyvinyl-carboxyphosphonate phosphorylmutase [Gracilaria domingensis]
MSGFSTAGCKGLPDTGLLGYKDMLENVAEVSDVIDMPLIADADTGFGNAVNVRRTVMGFAKAGASGLLIEDQVNPKRYCNLIKSLLHLILISNISQIYRCGHTKGKEVVDRDEALRRIRAACDARDEIADGDGGPVIIARTDAARFSFEEALTRARLFHELGADMTFVEAPQSREQMIEYCQSVPGLKLANMLEMGDTPILPPQELFEIGFSIAAYPLTLLSASVKAQEEVLLRLREGAPERVRPLLKSFAELRDVVGFPGYYDIEDKYR